MFWTLLNLNNKCSTSHALKLDYLMKCRFTSHAFKLDYLMKYRFKSNECNSVNSMLSACKLNIPYGIYSHTQKNDKYLIIDKKIQLWSLFILNYKCFTSQPYKLFYKMTHRLKTNKCNSFNSLNNNCSQMHKISQYVNEVTITCGTRRTWSDDQRY